MKNVAWIAWAIKNAVCVICCTTLAIVFNKWWIALFGLLFISSMETKPVYYRVCNKCGKHSAYAETYDMAMKRAEESGWIHYKDSNVDYCPDCQ